MFVYFVPVKIDRSSSESLNRSLGALDLGHIIDSHSDLIVRDLINGPNGSVQAIASKKTLQNDSLLGSFPQSQEVFAFDKFSIGRVKTIDADPKRLERSNAIESHPWVDSTGMTWQIPIAKRWDEVDGIPVHGCRLDRRLKLNRSGDWVYGDVLPQFQKLWDFACDYLSRLNAAQAAAVAADKEEWSLPEVDISAVCSIVFGTNYRVSKYEIGCLESLRMRDIFDIMSLVIDMPGFHQLQKKTV